MKKGYDDAADHQFDRKTQALRTVAITIVFLVLAGFLLKILFF
jgi:hypothetical protein